MSTSGLVSDGMPRLTLREATPADSRLVWEWRNDDATRAASKTVDRVGWQDHSTWFARTLSDPLRHLLVAEESERPVGIVRFDEQHEGEWIVSINLAPESRGRRLATPILDAGWHWLGAHVEGVNVVVAEIRVGNVASERSFEAAGYRLAEGGSDWLRYVRSAGAPA